MKRITAIFAAALIVFGCSKKDEPDMPPATTPELVSCDPPDGATGVSATALSLRLTFDMFVLCPTKDRSRIRVDGKAEITEINVEEKTVILNISGLDYSTSYRVTFPSGTITNNKGIAAADFSISFTTEDAPAFSGLNNPHATRQARNLYDFLAKNSGSKTLSGVQSGSSNSNDFVDLVYENTGMHPALAGYDFIFLHYSPTPSDWSWKQDYRDISAAKEHWESGGVVNYMWHWNVPDSEAAWKKGTDEYNFEGYGFYSDKTSFDINEALKEGTWQHDFLMKDLEEAAGYLRLLQDEGIPVIWRPLHEAAGNYDKYGPDGAWFWWGKGGSGPCKALWKLMYDRFVNVYGLDNLIWVWTVDVTEGCEDQFAEWYPGDEYVDIVGADIYEDNTDAKTRQYKALVELTGGKKPVTVSECGNIPDPAACMEAGNRWSWFMVWPGYDKDGNITMTPEDWKLNTLTWWKSIISNSYIINREDMPSLK